MALSVSDVSTSRRWYVETLGLHATMEIPYANGAAVTVLEGGGLIVELVQLDSAVARTRSAERIHGFFKAGIVVDDLDGVLAELRRRGAQVAFGPFPARDGQRANVIIRDNAGNLIQLFGRS
jgi:catechol 2,3-dioxygenase-like lactoylglutathione lyase family enzyme